MAVSQGVASLDERAAAERAYAEAAGRRALVCSLSGGVDSAVSALVAERAMPGQAVALLLPCSRAEELQGERGRDIVDAGRVAQQLGMPQVTINLSALWQQAVALYREALERLQAQGIAVDAKQVEWAVNNLKPTLRMMTAGFFADALQGLTVGTDNAIENFLGYFSVRGDGIADRQPIRDCTKAEVRALAAAGGLPADIVQRTPTAGLWPGQTDEGELGFTYDQADTLFLWLLARHVDGPEPVFEPTLTVRAAAVPQLLARADLPVPAPVAQRIIAQNQRTAFKRKADDLDAVLVRRGLRAPSA
jgi:NAD+ synthase